jgi:ribosomal protein S18 acetylase RimI-like enzyme
VKVKALTRQQQTEPSFSAVTPDLSVRGDEQPLIVDAQKFRKDKILQLQWDAVVRWIRSQVPKIIKNEYTMDFIDKSMLSPEHKLYLLLIVKNDASSIAGFCSTFELDDGTPYVCGIGLRQSAKGRQYGKRLLNYTMETYKTSPVVRACIRRDNEQSLETFKKVCAKWGRTISAPKFVPTPAGHQFGDLLQYDFVLQQ